ncbi:MAG: HAD family acid phosphatase [Bacteroidetes bacterium]|nr:HAD family acid phosphatase [Bacteroidota bacterium]
MTLSGKERRGMETGDRNVYAFLAFVLMLAAGTLSVQAQSSRHSDIYSVPEPMNLGILQDSVRSYIKSGAYERGLAEVADSAKSFIESRYTTVRKPAIVLDIDETSLSNIEFEYRYGFGFNSKLWNTWVREKAATAIKPTLTLARWAASHQIAIFFITGRSQISRDIAADPTVINLKKAGYPNWARIYFKNSRAISTSAFKTSARKEIESEGYTIVANIGDQYSDLEGGYAEGKFKLPDPMYYIP